MTFHKHCHGKLTPLTPTSIDMSLSFLEFLRLKCCASYYHLVLNENEGRPIQS